MESFPSEDDHVYHELLLDEVTTESTVPEGKTALSKEAFVQAFVRIGADGWNVAGAMMRLDIDC